jgi:ATP-dependent Clp protease ATP-binding subunit ClpA
MLGFIIYDSYIGYEDDGQLTEKVRRRPYSVILFDEVEKADPLVSNIFLQLLDDGVLTDGKGRTVDFKNTIIIMTSNVGSEILAASMDGTNKNNSRDLLMKEVCESQSYTKRLQSRLPHVSHIYVSLFVQVQKHFRPELLNRLSEIVIFDPLSRDQLREVVRIQMKNIVAVLADKGISLSASEDVLDVILLESYNPVSTTILSKSPYCILTIFITIFGFVQMYGARPIRRWVQKNVMTILSNMIVKGEICEGSVVYIDAMDDKKGLKYELAKKMAVP